MLRHQHRTIPVLAVTLALAAAAPALARHELNPLPAAHPSWAHFWSIDAREKR